MKKNILMKVVVGCLFLSLFATGASAKNRELYFYPTSITNFAEGYLYAWPSFKVLLHDKDQNGAYRPAVINDIMANELDMLFKPTTDSPVNLYRDQTQGYWGFNVTGGARLKKENALMADFMTSAFLSCVSTLELDEISQILGVAYSPASYVAPDGSVNVTAEMTIAQKMFDNYKNDQCSEGSSVVPELLKKKVSAILTQLLTGTSDSTVMTDGEIMVFTTVWNKLLFSPQGLWVRAVLSHIKTVVENQIKDFPFVDNSDVLNKDYESFVDVVLSNGRNGLMSKEQYLGIAKICGINSALSSFKACPLNSLSQSGRIEDVTLVIGDKKASYYFKNIA